MTVKLNIKPYDVIAFIPFGPSRPAADAFNVKRCVENGVGKSAVFIGSGIEVGREAGDADVQFGVDTTSQGESVMNIIANILKQHNYSSVKVMKNGRRPPRRHDMKATIWLTESVYYKEVMEGLKTGKVRLTSTGRVIWKKTKVAI